MYADTCNSSPRKHGKTLDCNGDFPKTSGHALSGLPLVSKTHVFQPLFGYVETLSEMWNEALDIEKWVYINPHSTPKQDDDFNCGRGFFPSQPS